MTFKNQALATVMFLAALSIRCGYDVAESKSMEQYHRENGVPVQVETVALREFTVDRVFHEELSGLMESTGYAGVGDKVEKIHLSVGDRVKKDQVVVSFPEDSPSAQYQQVTVAFENARTFYERMKNMYDAGGISEQDLDNARAQFEVAEANRDAARQAVKTKAPIDGVITRLYVEETDNVKKEAPLFTVSNTEKLKAAIWINEKYIDEFTPGLSAEAAWQGKIVHGTVHTVDLAFDDIRKAFRATVVFDNPGSLLSSGIDAEITVRTYGNPAAVVLDRHLLFLEDGESYVFIAEQGFARKRPVKASRISELKYEILDGLYAGDRIITGGRTMVEDGAKITIIDK